MANSSVIFGLALTLCCCCYCCDLAAADLAADLREFVDLLPRQRVSSIAARYYVFDPEFRSAVNFMRTPEFPKLMHQMAKSPGAADLVHYLKLHTSGQDLRPTVTKLVDKVRHFQMPRAGQHEFLMDRDMTSFLSETMDTLSRPKVYNFISRKLRDSKPFAKLYKALRDREFRDLVKATRRSADLKAPIKKLISKHIDIDEIINMSFEFLSWGPKSRNR